ncbi:MAG: LD-carboxypeptidase [Nitrospirae bacterium]|nr:LD-carboxypeptidase [Nitrospirota bacterium]MCL5285506.1 LD-carboxypeptidase [Nitrospirota bacterium]
MGRVLHPTRPLRSGDAILVVRTGLVAPFPEWDAVRLRLESVGLSPVLCDDPDQAFFPYAASDKERMRRFLSVVTGGQGTGILSYRGGSGAIRLLGGWEDPEKDFSGKVPLVCGFSDMTYLHAALARKLLLATFWGPNARELFHPESFDLWWKMVSGTIRKGDALALGTARTLRPGRASGRLLGGNLESLAHLCGTPFLPDFTGAILLIEDVDEPLYAIDRALRTLSLSGGLDRLAGVVVGPFSGWTPRGDDPAPSVADLVLSLFGRIPVMEAALPGHSVPMATWPLNVLVDMRCPEEDAPTLVLLESPFENPA